MTNDYVDKSKIAANIINRVLSGDITPEAALKEWPVGVGDTSLAAAEHALIHFRDMKTLGIKDKRYQEYQITQLKNIAIELEKGASMNTEDIEWFTPRKLFYLGLY